MKEHESSPVMHLIAGIFSIILVVSLLQIGSSSSLLEGSIFADNQNQTVGQVSETGATSINTADFQSGPAINPAYKLDYGPSPDLGSSTNEIISRLGYSSKDIWKSGIKVVSHDGRIEKACGGSSGLSKVSGLAIKPNAAYPLCEDGNSIIPSSYRTANKCTLHYDSSKANQTTDAKGNSTAIFAHELAHCLYFIYGEGNGIEREYLYIRVELSGQSSHNVKEIFADDFMICRHGVDTSWGAGSYYASKSVNRPTKAQCIQLNSLYNNFFPF